MRQSAKMMSLCLTRTRTREIPRNKSSDGKQTKAFRCTDAVKGNVLTDSFTVFRIEGLINFVSKPILLSGNKHYYVFKIQIHLTTVTGFAEKYLITLIIL